MIEMKNSGIEWIGEIPKHWVVKRLKDIAEFYTGNSLNESEKEYYGECSDVDSYPYIGSKDVERGISQINYKSGYRIPKNESKFVIAHAGDTLICIEGGSAGKKFGFVEQNVCFVNKLCCASTSLYDKFSYYYYNSNIFANQFNLQLQGMIGGVSVNKIKVMSIAIPPLAEQQAIADYLDKKTAEIDEQITALEKKSDAYQRLKRSLISEVVTRGLNPTTELKDSDIEWIGEIPEHWVVKRLKDIAEFYTGNSLNESEKEYYGECSDVDSYPYIGSKDVERGISQINYKSGYRIPKNESKFVIAHAGDTLICIEGGSAGKKFGFVEQNVCFVNKLCCASTSLYDKFSYYYYNSNIFANQFNLQLQGMIGGVSVNKIKVMSIAIPPLAEQQAIADYLDKKTAEIDGQITAISSKIDAYKRLKQSLIDEVVTGKRRIEKA